MTTIAIVTGSTRPGRKADAVARWVHNLAADRDDATFDVVDIADFALPHLDEATPPIMGRYEHAHPTRGPPRSPATTAMSSSHPSTTTRPRAP